MKISRRSFLKKGSASAAALSVTGSAVVLTPQKVAAAPSPLNKWPGRVVFNFNGGATSGTSGVEAVIAKMVDDSIKLLTGASTVGEAWKAIFPAGFGVTKTIAMKINMLRTDSIPPHPFMVKAIVEGLKQMDFGGTKYPAANITIYDGNNDTLFSTHGFTAASFPNVNMTKEISQTKWGDGAHNNQPYSKVLHDCDYLINLPSLRGHSPYVGSVTLGFKSHYGTYPTLYHNDSAHGYLRDINCTGPVFNKTVLTVNSALLGCREGVGPTGPAQNYATYVKTMDPASTAVNPSTILMSTDPVAIEFQAIKIMRIQGAKSYTVDSMPAFLKASGGVTGALTPFYNIGEINETKMDIRKIINGQIVGTFVEPSSQTSGGLRKGDLSISRTPSGYFVEFTTTEAHVGQSALVTITNAQGQLVWRNEIPILGVRNHFGLSGEDVSGRRLPRGAYTMQIRSGRTNIVKQLTVA